LGLGSGPLLTYIISPVDVPHGARLLRCQTLIQNQPKHINMKKHEPVSTIMTHHVYVVDIKDSLESAREVVRKHNVRHVPVVQKGKLVGIISKTDLNRLTFSGMFEGEGDTDEAVLDMLNLSQVMSHKPRVVRAGDDIRAVAKILSEEEFHALPVVDDENETKLVGIVTTTDVIRYLLERFL
jgi:CBS domain-containing protein